MEQKRFANWLKVILSGVGLIGTMIYLGVFPIIGGNMLAGCPDFTVCFWSWLLFLWATGIPFYAALVLCWRIVSSVGAGDSFTRKNAERFNRISYLAAFDTIFFFVGDIIFYLLDMSHPIFLLLSLIVVFIGVSVAVVSAVLSRLVQKAADLQEQSDFTI